MNFQEVDAQIRTIISNTIETCGGKPDELLVDASATIIERLACENVPAWEEQNALHGKLNGSNGTQRRRTRKEKAAEQPASAEPNLAAFMAP